MTGLQKKTTIITILAATLAVVAGPDLLAAQSSPTSGADAKACQLMPTPDLEAAYGGKVTNPHGSDGESSVCTVNIGGLAIKLQSAPAGTSGVPASIQEGLVGARMMAVAPASRRLSCGRLARTQGPAGCRRYKSQTPETEAKDFGKVGCLSMKMTKGFDGKPLARPLFTASCFLVNGGYLNMSVAGENAKQVRLDVVKDLLEKAAARR